MTSSKNGSLLLLCSCLVLGACATNRPKDASVDAGAAKAVAAARPGSPGPGDHAAPIMVGPDIIAAVPSTLAWRTISDVQNWGVWNPKVTEVQPGAGLNTGSDLQWKWEEKMIHSTVTAVADGESLTFRGCRSGADISLRWMLKPLDDQHTVVSLRAILPAGAGATLIANAGLETQAWINALQDELNKQAAALPVVKKGKKRLKKA